MKNPSLQSIQKDSFYGLLIVNGLTEVLVWEAVEDPENSD
jgi:hypothetical protein